MMDRACAGARATTWARGPGPPGTFTDRRHRRRGLSLPWPCYAHPVTGERNHRALLLETGLALSSERTLPAILQRIVEMATQLTGARYGALGVIGRDGGISQFVYTGMSPEQHAAIGHLPVGKGILGALIQDARPLRLRDLSKDPRSSGFPPSHPPMRSFLGAPVMARGQVFGNVYLTEKRDAEEFDADDERAVLVLAAQAGV